MEVYILHIETSSKICSVAISRNEQLIIIQEEEKENSHAARLTTLIEQVVNKANLTFQDLQAISFSSGPGSYTGLRIGLSTAKGLCYSLNIPLLFVPTLDALLDEMIEVLPDKEAIYTPMIDARRMEAYLFQKSIEKHTITPTQAFIFNEDTIENLNIDKKLILAGDFSKKAQSLLYNKNMIYLDIKTSSSKYMIKSAFEKYLKNDFENVAYCEPFYLKKPVNK